MKGIINLNDAYGVDDDYRGGQEVGAGSFETGKQYVIRNVGDTNWASIGATSVASGAVFTATGAGSGTGTAFKYDGLYKRFHSIMVRNTDNAADPVAYPQYKAWVDGDRNHVFSAGYAFNLMTPFSNMTNYFNTGTMTKGDIWEKPLIWMQVTDVNTGADITANITNNTLGLPSVFTAVAHGFSNGMAVSLSGLDGSAASLNGQTLYVKTLTTDTFELHYNTGLTNPVYFLELAVSQVSSSDIAAPTTFTLTAPEQFTNGERVTATNFNNSFSFLNGNQYYIKEINSTNVQLATDPGLTTLVGLSQGYSGSIDDIVIGDWNAPIKVEITDNANPIINSQYINLSSIVGFGQSDLNGTTKYLKIDTGNFYELYDDQALTNPTTLGDIAGDNSEALPVDSVTLIYGGTTLTNANTTYADGDVVYAQTEQYGIMDPYKSYYVKNITTGTIELYTDKNLTTLASDFTDWKVDQLAHLDFTDLPDDYNYRLPVYSDQGTELTDPSKLGWFTADVYGDNINPTTYWLSLSYIDGYKKYLDGIDQSWIDTLGPGGTGGLSLINLIDTNETYEGKKLFYFEVNGTQVGPTAPLDPAPTLYTYGINNADWNNYYPNRMLPGSPQDYQFLVDVQAKYPLNTDVENIFSCTGVTNLAGTKTAKFFRVFMPQSGDVSGFIIADFNKLIVWFYETIEDVRAGSHMGRCTGTITTTLEAHNFDYISLSDGVPPDDFSDFVWPSPLNSDGTDSSFYWRAKEFFIPKYYNATPKANFMKEGTSGYELARSLNTAVINGPILTGSAPTNTGALNPFYEKVQNGMTVYVNDEAFGIYLFPVTSYTLGYYTSAFSSASFAVQGYQAILVPRIYNDAYFAHNYDGNDYSSRPQFRLTSDAPEENVDGYRYRNLVDFRLVTSYENDFITEAPVRQTNFIDRTGYTLKQRRAPIGVADQNLVYIYGIRDFVSGNYQIGQIYTAATAGTLTNDGAPFTSSTTGTAFYDAPTIWGVGALSFESGGNNPFQYRNTSGNYVNGVRVKGWWNYDNQFRTFAVNPGVTFGQTGSGYLNSTTLTSGGDFGVPWLSEGQYLLMEVEPLPDTYVTPVLSTAELADAFPDTDYWTNTEFDSRKVWPTTKWPVSTKLNMVQPDIATKTLTGIKYVRSGGFTRWQAELNYGPLTRPQFDDFFSFVQEVRGQKHPFLLNMILPNGKNMLFGNVETATGEVYAAQPQTTINDPIIVEGFDSFQQNLLPKGSVFTTAKNDRNGYANTQIAPGGNANAYGEALIRPAWAMGSLITGGDVLSINPSQITVTMAENGFEYSVDRNELYYFSVTFDLDEWK